MFLDTSGLLCFQDADDGRHVRVVECFGERGSKVTHNYVLAGYVALCQARGYSRGAVLRFSFELLENPHVALVWILPTLHRKALLLLQARPDKSYSLCDAVSFVVIRERGVSDALTTDRHFEQEGFRRLP